MHTNVCNVADRTIQNVKTVESIHLHKKIDSFEYDRVLSKTAFFTVVPVLPVIIVCLKRNQSYTLEELLELVDDVNSSMFIFASNSLVCGS